MTQGTVKQFGVGYPAAAALTGAEKLSVVQAGVTVDTDTNAVARAGLLSGSVVFDPPNILAGGTTATTVTVTGAALGDFAQASFSLSLGGLTMTAYVSAANTVTVVLHNPTAGAINLGSGTLRARVRAF